MKDLLQPPQNSKNGFEGAEAGFSPPFLLFENWKIQRG